jgi:hypothetical protein
VASGSFGLHPKRSAITSHHVGRVDVIAVDEHARHTHHDIVRNAQSVGAGTFDGVVEAYIEKVRVISTRLCMERAFNQSNLIMFVKPYQLL